MIRSRILRHLVVDPVPLRLLLNAIPYAASV
jgi:hypothetical protein